MNIALGIVSLFAHGGLQRDCLAIRRVLLARRHQVQLFAARCDPQLAQSNGVTLLQVSGRSNHARDTQFGEALQEATRHGFDVVVGFNKLPGLDVLYCADPSVAARPMPAWKRWLPRTRARMVLEEACFSSSAKTHVMLLSPAAAAAYRAHWMTPNTRLSILPPTVASNRRLGLLPQGRSVRQQTDVVVWLWIGAQPHTKGLDRVLRALAAQPATKLRVVGIGINDKKAAPYVRLAKRLKLDPVVSWLGYREDIPELMAMADLLVHPARFDMTGQVILEAIVNGLPVVTTSACGYAEHVSRADAGMVVDDPFHLSQLTAALDLARRSAASGKMARKCPSIFRYLPKPR